MSERFLCGPEMRTPRLGTASRFADSASQGRAAPHLRPHVPMQQGFSPGSSIDVPEGSGSFSELTEAERIELEEVRRPLPASVLCTSQHSTEQNVPELLCENWCIHVALVSDT